MTREQLEKEYGQVWDTAEMTEEFYARSFCAPFVAVTRRKDCEQGVLAFQHMPRFYFDFTPTE